MFKKAKLYTVVGITLIVHAISCFVVFCATYKEKKGLGSAFFALFVAFATAGSAALVIADESNELKVRQAKRRIRHRDHWFHNFEYPTCKEPKITIDHTRIPKVETED